MQLFIIACVTNYYREMGLFKKKHNWEPVKEFIVETAINTWNWRVTVEYCSKTRIFRATQQKTNDKRVG